MRIFVIALLVVAPFTADAQTLYRCVQKGKPTIFQSEPCPATARTASAMDYVPDPRAAPYRPATVQTSPPRVSRQAPGAQVHQITAAASTSACEAAKARREFVLGSNNQRGNVDVRRQLNDAVASACY